MIAREYRCRSESTLKVLKVLCRNYLLAQARVDAPGLASSIAHLNTNATFTPLQALQDTDVAGYLRHAHEQNLISTIEEGRRETQEEFYRVLEERGRRDWEARKKRVFEQLGARVGGENRAVAEMKKGSHGKGLLSVSFADFCSVSRGDCVKCCTENGITDPLPYRLALAHHKALACKCRAR